MNAGLLQ